MNSRLRDFPLLLYLHLVLTGFAVSVIAFISLRQYALLIGEHMIALSTLLAAFVLNIAIGSRVLGKRADSTGNVAKLAMLLELGISLYAFAVPVLGMAFEKSVDVVAQHAGTGFFRVSIYRFILLIVFLSPMTFAGALIPVFSKYLIRHVSHVGRKSGIVFAMTGFGALAGACTAGLFLVQRFGYSVSLMMTAGMFLVNTGLLKLVHARKAAPPSDPPSWSMAMKARKSGMTLLKNRFVLDAEAKLIHTLLWVFAIEGFAAMSFMILWTRTLTILLRSDITRVLYVATLVAITGIATGSLLFRGLADRPRKRFYLLGLIEMLTGISAALSFVGVYLMYSLTGKGNSAFLSLTEDIPQGLILASVLLFLPSLFLGASFPVASRLYPKRIQRIGRRIGWLGFVFLIGTAISLFLTPFILIPLLGVYITFFLFAIVTILIGLILILRDSRFKKAFRLANLVLSVVLILLLLSLFRHHDQSIRSFELVQQDTLQVRREGSTASVMLVERTDGHSDLIINGNTVLQTDRDNIRVQQLLAFLPGLFNESMGSAYLGGFGLGVTASSLEMCGFGRIVISETSPEAIALTSSAFGELNNDILIDQAVSISIEDSRSLLYRSAEKFDVITFSYIYPHIKSGHFSREFYELCLNHLADNGILCQPLPASWYGSPVFLSVLKTCSGVFTDVSLWYTGADRIILLASRENPSRNFCELKQRFELLNAGQELTRIGLPITEALLSCLVLDDSHIREISDGFPEITDNMPVWAMNLMGTGTEEDRLPYFSEIEGTSYADWLDISGNCVTSVRYTLNIIESYKKILLGAPGN